MVRRGYTLVELMVASTLFVLALSGVVAAFVGVQRMTRTALAEAELSVRMRELREKLLFHAAPPHDGRMWSGVLSGTDDGSVVEGGNKVKMYTCWGYDVSANRPVAQRIELVRVAAERRFGNDGDRHDDSWSVKWLAPGGLAWLPEANAVDDASLAGGNVFCLNLEASAAGYVRRERIVVPVFGTEQPAGGIGGVP